MTAVALDTHEVVKELKAAGSTDEQAEAVTRVVRRAQDIDLSNLATKSDIAALKSDIDGLRSATKSDIAALKSDIEALRSGTKSDLQVGLADLRTEILKWTVGTVGVHTVLILGTVIALVRLLPH